MTVAFVTTKYPILIDKGFWSFAHEYRTDFAMTVLLIVLLIYSGNKTAMILNQVNLLIKNQGETKS